MSNSNELANRLDEMVKNLTISLTIAERETLTKAAKKLRAWEASCTGRHGSQQPCVREERDCGFVSQ